MRRCDPERDCAFCAGTGLIFVTAEPLEPDTLAEVQEYAKVTLSPYVSGVPGGKVIVRCLCAVELS